MQFVSLCFSHPWELIWHSRPNHMTPWWQDCCLRQNNMDPSSFLLLSVRPCNPQLIDSGELVNNLNAVLWLIENGHVRPKRSSVQTSRGSKECFLSFQLLIAGCVVPDVSSPSDTLKITWEGGSKVKVKHAVAPMVSWKCLWEKGCNTSTKQGTRQKNAVIILHLAPLSQVCKYVHYKSQTSDCPDKRLPKSNLKT